MTKARHNKVLYTWKKLKPNKKKLNEDKREEKKEI